MPSGAERFPTFNAALATIDAIQNAIEPFVVTSFPHTFITGQYISFRIPQEYGMIQLNNITALIIDVPSASSVQINVDTTNFDVFVVPIVPLQSAQAVPSGELATQFYGPNVNVTAFLPPFPPYPNPSPHP